MKKFMLLSAFILSGAAFGDMLTTEHYIVEIERHCQEGSVTCDKVSYVGVSKTSGNRIELKGKTLHSLCADGVTPCRFQGYQFKNGNTTYKVFESGLLQVIQNNETVLVEEQGDWSY